MDEFEKKLLEQNEQERKWTFRRDVSVGNVITVALVIFSALAAYFSLNTRTIVLENALVSQRVIDERQDAEATRRDLQAQAQLERINSKLDRLMERR